LSTKDSIKSQYYASLDMLKQAIIKCPGTLWDDRAYKNVFWHVSYHALFYTHLYLQPSLENFVPWAKHRKECGSLAGEIGEPYTKEELLEYHALCRKQVEEQVAGMDPEAPSGFSWLPCDKLELQFYNIRHLQQHIGELGERLGAKGDIAVDWVMRQPG
jgi:hypothetical protein